MSIKKDIDELLWYTVLNARDSAGEDWADELLESCRRVYERNVRDEATSSVDRQLKVWERELATEGKVLKDRAGFRKEQVEFFVGHYKTFDEWKEGF